MDQPIGFWFLENREERRPRYRRLRPRQLAPIEPPVPDDSSSDEIDSPSPTTTSFPSSTAAPPPNAGPTDVVANPIRPPVAEQPAAGETERAGETTSSDSQPRPTELSTLSTITTAAPTTTSSTDTTSSSSSSSTESSSSSSSSSQATADAASQIGSDNAGRTVDPKLGIAFGSIGAAAVLLCIGVGIWWCMRRRSRKKAKLTPPASRAPSQLFTQEAAARLDQRSVRRAPSSLMGELMTAAYADNQGVPAQQSMPSQNQYVEKGPHVIASQAPPAGFAANARTSIASWVNRLNPLRLNAPSEAYQSSRQSSMSDVRRAVPADASAPPVPVVPFLFQSRTMQKDDDMEPLVQPPEPAIRPPSSRYELPVDDVHRSSFSFYGRDPTSRDDVPPLRTMRPQRQPSMAPTIHTTISGADTESSWQSWGAGLGRPQYQPDPMPSPKGWLHKFPGFGPK
ncbi:hypothetical protein ACHAQF_008519 [Verticillium nonalfalfae]